MRFLIILGVALSGVVTAANAQSVLEMAVGVKFCRTLKEDGARLKCFDDLFAEKAKPDKSDRESVADVRTWAITEDKSPIDDSPQVLAIMRASSGDAMLALRCREKRTEAIFTGGFLGSIDRIKVVVRIGEGKPISTSWNPSTAGTGAFAPSPVQFIQALSDNEKLFIRAVGYGGRQVDGMFNLGNISEVRDKISHACSWKESPKK
jgi:hypothetical protein